MTERLTQTASLSMLSCFRILLDTCHTLWSTPVHHSSSLCPVSFSAYHFADSVHLSNRSYGIHEFTGGFELKTSLEKGHQRIPLFSAPSAFVLYLQPNPGRVQDVKKAWTEMSIEAKQPYILHTGICSWKHRARVQGSGA